MDRMRRNPGAWGLALGAGVFVVAIFLKWVEVTNKTGSSSTFRLWGSVSGGSLFGICILAAICGVGIIASAGRGRIIWAILGLFSAAVLLAASIWALVDPSGFITYAESSNAFTHLLAESSIQQSYETVSKAFDSGTLSATVKVGAIVGLIGGLLVLVGALFSFRKPLPEE
jgi:hypothetical protein